MSRAKEYPSDLTDEEWAILEPLLEQPRRERRGKPRTVERREVLNAILYVLRTGCQWRALPHEYPPWSTAYWWFRQWRLDGTWERVAAALRGRGWVKAGRDPEPSAAVLDSQSVTTTEQGGPEATTAARG